MNTIEVLELTEAKDLINVGRFSEALARLTKLAIIYPKDKEVYDLIQMCTYQTNLPQAQPLYYNQPQFFYQPVKSKSFGVYHLIWLGLAAIFVSLFLPWFVADYGAAFNNQYGFSLNLFGSQVSGTPQVRAFYTPEQNLLIGSLIITLLLNIAGLAYHLASKTKVSRYLLLILTILLLVSCLANTVIMPSLINKNLTVNSIPTKNTLSGGMGTLFTFIGATWLLICVLVIVTRKPEQQV